MAKPVFLNVKTFCDGRYLCVSAFSNLQRRGVFAQRKHRHAQGVKEEQGMWGMQDRASAACVATNVGPVPLLKDAGPCHGRAENSEATSGDSASLGPALVDCYRSATPSPNMLG